MRERAEKALAEEIRLMLDEGVVQAVQDIDLCMLLGAGWPFWLGGISAAPGPHRRLRGGHRVAVPAEGCGLAARLNRSGDLTVGDLRSRADRAGQDSAR